MLLRRDAENLISIRNIRLAEGAGFEPAVREHGRFQDGSLKPLGHPSRPVKFSPAAGIASGRKSAVAGRARTC